MKIIFLLSLVAFVADTLFLHIFQQRKQTLKLFASSKKSGKPYVPQILKHRSEDDCPVCRAAREAGLPPSPNCTHTPDPWSEAKDCRGRKKTICTREALEGRRNEWEYQHGICGTCQPHNPTGCLKINAADMGKGAIWLRTFGASVLVDGLLSFCAGA